MEFFQLIKKRCSMRSYLNQAVEQQKMQKILEAGRIAPTAKNLQPNIFLVLDTPQAMQKLQNACRTHGAPCAIIVCADKNISWVRPMDQAPMCDIDATIATDHMMLQAQDLGLGSCWITWFDRSIVCKEFNVPQNLIPINILVFGYAAAEPTSPDRHQTTRKPLEDIVFKNSF